MSDEWAEAKSCTWMHEALFLQSVLEAAGIESLIPNEHTLNAQPLYANMLGGVRVLVRSEDLERAREILESTALPAEEDANDER